jgi:hypothetical protein
LVQLVMFQRLGAFALKVAVAAMAEALMPKQDMVGQGERSKLRALGVVVC